MPEGFSSGSKNRSESKGICRHSPDVGMAGEEGSGQLETAEAYPGKRQRIASHSTASPRVVDADSSLCTKGSKKLKQARMNVLRYLARPDVQQTVPELSQLVQCDVDVGGKDISPGSMHGNRVAIQGLSGGQQRIFVSSGKQVFVVDSDDVLGGSEANWAGMLRRGKGGVYLPTVGSEGKHVECKALPSLQMQSEIQSLHISAPESTGESTMISTDMYGRALCTVLNGECNENDVGVRSMYTLQPEDGALVREAGWTGGVVSPCSRNIVAIARHFPKDVTVFDESIPMRRFSTLYNPNDVLLLSSDVSEAETGDGAPLLGVAEGNIVTIWDLRIGGTGARVNRLNTGPYGGHLYTIAATSRDCPLLGAAGEDRDVCVWDPRMWKKVDRWTHCSKYEITSLHFMRSNPRYCVVGGLDYELACGAWFHNVSKAFQSNVQKQQAAAGRAAGPVTEVGSIAETMRQSRVSASFRGNSRWIGVAQAPGDVDMFCAVTSDATLYLSRF